MGRNWIESLDARRLLAAYAPDVSFGTDGFLPPDPKAFGNDIDVTLVHQDSRGLLVTSKHGGYQTASLTLERYTLDGRPDPDFTPRDLGPYDYTPAPPFADRQGRVLLVQYGEGSTLNVTRYTADGRRDTSFGNKGTAVTAELLPLAKGEHAYNVAPYEVEITDGPDGSVYLSGYRSVYGVRTESKQHFVLKLTGSGQIDTAFGTGGVLLAATNSFFSTLSTSTDKEEFFLAIDPQNRLIAGQTIEFGKFTFTRFTRNGQIDTTFADNGVFNYDIGPVGFSALAFFPAVDAQGRALLLAEAGGKNKLLRLTTSGQLDTTFGESGVVTNRGYPHSLIVQSDGKLVTQIGAGSVYYIRFNADGSRDTSFGPDGLMRVVQTDNVPELLFYASTVVTKLTGQLADGSFVTTLSTRNGDSFQKMSLATPVRRGSSGRLYLLGDDASDSVSVTANSGGGARVVFNGTTTNITKRVTGVVADLAGGDNRLDAAIDVPQTVSTAGGNDTITTGDADDNIFTRDGSDTIKTNGGYDTIKFYGGDKTVDAGNGSGYITGGPSGNTVARPGRVRVTGGTTDGTTQGGWLVDVRGTRVSVTLAGGSAKVGVTASETAAIDVVNVRSRVSAAVSGKRVTFDARRATVNLDVAATVGSTITAGPGDDTIRGGRAADTIDAGGGNDRVYGNGGNDSIVGGEGNDVLVGGEGNDSLYGGPGDDRLFAGVPGRPADGVINFLDGGDGDDGYAIENRRDRLSAVEQVLR